MEAQNNINIHHENDGGSNSNMKPPPSFLCRQSSTRWTPTTDQIKILRELYYSNGIRSPSADQIQRISARLRQYGKIEGKNVFYWFQNHKARERQKKRFTTTSSTTNNNNELLINNHMNMNMSIPSAASAFHRNNNTVNPGHWRSCEDHSSVTYNSNYASPTYITPPPGFAAIGQIGSHCYGSVAMEQSFRECSISPNDYHHHHHHHSNGAPMNQHIINSSSVPTPYPFLDKLNSSYDHETLDEDEDDDDDDYHQAVREIETLPLFPMHGEDHYGSSSTAFNCNNYKAAESSNGHNYYAGGWYQSDHIGASRASLELSLNSYGSRSTNQFY